VSVLDLRYVAQLGGCRRAESQEFQVRRDLLEQHISVPTCVAQPRCCAALRNGVIAVFITTSPTNVVAATRFMSMGSGSPSFMPRGVAFTTRS
jgi:hypothetical protein